MKNKNLILSAVLSVFALSGCGPVDNKTDAALKCAAYYTVKDNCLLKLGKPRDEVTQSGESMMRMQMVALLRLRAKGMDKMEALKVVTQRGLEHLEPMRKMAGGDTCSTFQQLVADREATCAGWLTLAPDLSMLRKK